VAFDVESTSTARVRLLAAGKSLFARAGYEQASTAAIARAALSSESQLSKYFGSKAGLLNAILDSELAPLVARMQGAVADATTAREAVLALLTLLTRSLAKDQDFATVFLFEARRQRAPGEPMVAQSVTTYYELFQRLVRRGQKDGSFPAGLDANALASAIVGASEALLRDRLGAVRSGRPALDEDELTRVLAALVQGLAPSPSAAAVR
jgi:AcrR family transcriptional regulator